MKRSPRQKTATLAITLALCLVTVETFAKIPFIGGTEQQIGGVNGQIDGSSCFIKIQHKSYFFWTEISSSTWIEDRPVNCDDGSPIIPGRVHPNPIPL